MAPEVVKADAREVVCAALTLAESLIKNFDKEQALYLIMLLKRLICV